MQDSNPAVFQSEILQAGGPRASERHTVSESGVLGCVIVWIWKVPTGCVLKTCSLTSGGVSGRWGMATEAWSLVGADLKIIAWPLVLADVCFLSWQRVDSWRLRHHRKTSPPVSATINYNPLKPWVNNSVTFLPLNVSLSHILSQCLKGDNAVKMKHQLVKTPTTEWWLLGNIRTALW